LILFSFIINYEIKFYLLSIVRLILFSRNYHFSYISASFSCLNTTMKGGDK